ncbi:MAG: hypothetical protein EXR85_02585 [Xanthomonadales bacterium]|nr:hypothetical protein [Xanthomonadales bacterium]
MHFPDFEPWSEEEAAEAFVWDARISAEEAQMALKLILAGEYKAAAGLLANSINVAAYYAAAAMDTEGRDWQQSVLHGKKSGENRSKNSKDIKAEWQQTADRVWKKRPGLPESEIAETIAQEMIGHNAGASEDNAIKVYSVGYIGRSIKEQK